MRRRGRPSRSQLHQIQQHRISSQRQRQQRQVQSTRTRLESENIEPAVRSQAHASVFLHFASFLKSVLQMFFSHHFVFLLLWKVVFLQMFCCLHCFFKVFFSGRFFRSESFFLFRKDLFSNFFFLEEVFFVSSGSFPSKVFFFSRKFFYLQEGFVSFGRFLFFFTYLLFF